MRRLIASIIARSGLSLDNPSAVTITGIDGAALGLIAADYCANVAPLHGKTLAAIRRRFYQGSAALVPEGGAYGVGGTNLRHHGRITPNLQDTTAALVRHLVAAINAELAERAFKVTVDRLAAGVALRSEAEALMYKVLHWTPERRRPVAEILLLTALDDAAGRQRVKAEDASGRSHFLPPSIANNLKEYK